MTLKQRVVTQVNRIKALQSSIQEQVAEMKRLEVGYLRNFNSFRA